MTIAVPDSTLATESAYAPAKRITLRNAAGLELQVLDYGATWLSCTLPLPEGGRREVLLGCGSLAQFQSQVAYVGATPGRYANRIKKARFMLDGKPVQLIANEGDNQLHGGPDGFDRRFWHIESQDERSLVLSLVSPDGDQGYPGEVHARVSYLLGDDLSVELVFEATTSKPCPINLTHHAYFNLDGDAGAASRSVIDHQLQVNAGYWLPVDEENIPVDDYVSVEGTGFDLRQARRLADAASGDSTLGNGFDHCYALNSCYSLDASCADTNQTAALLTSGDGRVQLSLSTDLPALQVYNGAFLGGTPARDGTIYPAFSGIALEPQFAPDSPNHAVSEPHWPDCVVRPGQTFRHRSLLRFTVSDA